MLTLGMSFCLRKVLALVISSSLDSSEYWDSRTLSMHLGGRGVEEGREKRRGKGGGEGRGRGKWRGTVR